MFKTFSLDTRLIIIYKVAFVNTFFKFFYTKYSSASIYPKKPFPLMVFFAIKDT